jgi:dGTPase
VTQVVNSEEGQIFHNRLTHSLEVAQIGRRLCEKLIAEQTDLANSLPIDPDVVEAACLAHDLGHPPFGHVAEVLLDELAVQRGLHDGFEGNPQSFRIVTRLAFQSAGVDGLDLTRATLNAILKYPWLRQVKEARHRKWGAYATEEKDLEFARELSAKGDDCQSPEAEIMDWADDITYSVHDLEDFYQAGLIPLHLLTVDKQELQRFFDGAKKRLSDLEGRELPGFDKLTESFEGLLTLLMTDPEFDATREQTGDLGIQTSVLITRYLSGTKLREPDEYSDSGVLSVADGFKREVKMLKELTWHYVINNPALATQQYGQRKLIRDLFAIYHEVANNEKDWHVFSASTREQLETLGQQGAPKDRFTRLIVDLIAGMTEKHLIEMHRRLTGASLGSAFDYRDR